MDDLMDSTTDIRFRISLRLRPDNLVKGEIQKLLPKIRLIEPNPYCYRYTVLRVTIISIISGYNGFNLNEIRIEDYIKIINGLSLFNLEFRGLIISPSGLMIQGFFRR